MTDLVPLQEAEGKVKAARDALAREEARASEAHALADASVERAREAVAAAEREATALLDAAYKVLNDRRDRLFPAPEQCVKVESVPLRPIGLSVVNEDAADVPIPVDVAHDLTERFLRGNGFYAQGRAQTDADPA